MSVSFFFLGMNINIGDYVDLSTIQTLICIL